MRERATDPIAVKTREILTIIIWGTLQSIWSRSSGLVTPALRNMGIDFSFDSMLSSRLRDTKHNLVHIGFETIFWLY